jgi:hypothetical protein
MKCSDCKKVYNLVVCPRKISLPFETNKGCAKGTTHFRKKKTQIDDIQEIKEGKKNGI